MHFAGIIYYSQQVEYEKRHSSANRENVNKINLHGVETQGRPTLKVIQDIMITLN